MVINIDFRKKKQESTLGNDLDDFCTLSYKARIIGFICCLLAGAIIILLGYLAVMVPVPKIRIFIILYSLGNVIALASTMFLMGPMNQAKMMFKSRRIVASCVYLTFLLLTLIMAFKGLLLLAILCTVLQLLALIWYGLSFIPYARTMVKKCLGIPTEL